MTDTPRIYVASLSDYNAGRLHGKWIDADQDASEIWDEINAMLAASPEKHTCQWCGQKLGITEREYVYHVDGERTNKWECDDGKHTAFPGNAEEWAIHDYEGFGNIKLSEYESIERVAMLGEAIANDDHDGAMAAWLGESDDNTPDDFDDHFRGHWDDFKSFVMESELGDMVLGLSELKSLAREGARFSGMPIRTADAVDQLADNVSNYIDWDALARDQESEYTVIRCGEPLWGVWVFEDNV